MNSLSWFLYLAEVLPNLAGTIVALSGILVVAITIVSLFRTIAVVDSGMTLTPRKAEYKLIWGFWGKTVIPLLLLGTLMNLIPSRETIYLIAGSEAGEAVVTSQEGQEILNDIKEVIRYQLGELKGAQEKSSETP